MSECMRIIVRINGDFQYSSNVVNLNGIEVQKSGVFDYAGNGWTDDDDAFIILE